MKHRIAVMGGDGVGPELVGHALRVLDAVAKLDNFEVELVEMPHSGAHYRETGVLIDDDAYDTLRSCESLLFGAAGDPALGHGFVERALILDLSRELDLCLGIRSAYLHNENLTPLKGVSRGGVDMMIVRDCTEGEASIVGGSLHKGTPFESAASVMLHTRYGVERAIRHAFEHATRRRGRLSLIAQSNVIAPHRLWEDVFDQVALDFPDVEHEALYPDNAVMHIIADPAAFDVVVTNLLFGGVLSDMVAALVGGIGLIGSSRINPDTRFGMFEPAHGSAPKYTGLDKVSPMATLKALAMMLDNVGEAAAASRIDAAMDHVLSTGKVPGVTTRSGMGTAAATDEVLAALDAPAEAEARG